MIYKQKMKEWLLIYLNLLLYLISFCLWAVITIWLSVLPYPLFLLAAVFIGIIFAIFLMILSARTIRSWRRWLWSIPIQLLLCFLFFCALSWNAIVQDPIYYTCLVLVPCMIQALGLAVKWVWQKIE